MFRKLHIKLTAYMGLILVLFMGFIAMGIYNFTRIVFEDGTKKLMQSEAVKIYTYHGASFSAQTLYDEKNLFFSLSPRIAIMGSDKLEASYIMYDGSINVICAKNDKNEISEMVADLAASSFNEKKDLYVVRKIKGVNYRIYTKYFKDIEKPKVVQIYQNTLNEEIIWSFLRTVLFLLGTSGMLLLICISYVFTGKALRPVKDAWIRQKEFVADASHELRTPLTVIQTNLDVLLSNEEETFEENEIWINNAYSETRVMAKLIDHLLLLAKGDSNDVKPDLSEFSISEVVDNVCAGMELVAKNKRLDFKANIEENILIRADYDKIRRLVVILIDNAIKYTESGMVTVRLFTEKNKKILVVEDTGIGICKDDLDRIFDRFYRADKARRREGGSGLGLSIAKWIADMHRFSLTVESVVDEGSRFTLRM